MHLIILSWFVLSSWPPWLCTMLYILNRPREHLLEDVFEVARLRKEVPIRRPASHTTAAANMHNLQEFNHLKYRGKCHTEFPVFCLKNLCRTLQWACNFIPKKVPKIPFTSLYYLHIFTNSRTHFLLLTLWSFVSFSVTSKNCHLLSKCLFKVTLYYTG